MPEMGPHACANCGAQCDGSDVTQSSDMPSAIAKLVKKVTAHTRNGKDVSSYMRGGDGPNHRKAAKILDEHNQRYGELSKRLPGVVPPPDK